MNHQVKKEEELERLHIMMQDLILDLGLKKENPKSTEKLLVESIKRQIKNVQIKKEKIIKIKIILSVDIFI